MESLLPGQDRKLYGNNFVSHHQWRIVSTGFSEQDWAKSDHCMRKAVFMKARSFLLYHPTASQLGQLLGSLPSQEEAIQSLVDAFAPKRTHEHFKWRGFFSLAVLQAAWRSHHGRVHLPVPPSWLRGSSCCGAFLERVRSWKIGGGGSKPALWQLPY